MWLTVNLRLSGSTWSTHLFLRPPRTASTSRLHLHTILAQFPEPAIYPSKASRSATLYRAFLTPTKPLTWYTSATLFREYVRVPICLGVHWPWSTGRDDTNALTG